MPNTYQSIEDASGRFWRAHDEELFPQATLVAVTGLAPAWFERARWEGIGPKFLKLGRLVRYRKADVLAWINQSPIVSSTSENKGAPRSSLSHCRKTASGG